MESVSLDIPWEKALGFYTDLKWRINGIQNNPENRFKNVDIYDVTDTS